MFTHLYYAIVNHDFFLTACGSQRLETCLRGTCPPSEDSDQPAYSRFLIRIFAWHIWINNVRSFLVMRTTQTLTDCADAQADLSLRSAHMSKDTFSHVAVDYNSVKIMQYELVHDKLTKWHVRPANTQISLGIRPV